MGRLQSGRRECLIDCAFVNPKLVKPVRADIEVIRKLSYSQQDVENK